MGLDDLYGNGTGSKIDPPKTTGVVLKDKQGNDINMNPSEQDIRAAEQDRKLRDRLDRQIRRASRGKDTKKTFELMAQREKIFGTSSPNSPSISSAEQNREQDWARAADKKSKGLRVAGMIDPRTNKPAVPAGVVPAESDAADDPAGVVPAGADAADDPAVADAQPAGGKGTPVQGEMVGSAGGQEGADAIVDKVDGKRKENELEKIDRQAKEAGIDTGFEDDFGLEQGSDPEMPEIEKKPSRLDEIRNRKQDTKQVAEIEAAKARIESRKALMPEDEAGLSVSELTEKRRKDYNSIESRAARELSIRDEVSELQRPYREELAAIKERSATQTQKSMRRSTASDTAYAVLSSKEQAMQDADIDTLKGQDKNISMPKTASIPDRMRFFDPNKTLAERAELVMPSDAEMEGKSPDEINKMVKNNVRIYENSGKTFAARLGGLDRPQDMFTNDDRLANAGAIEKSQRAMLKKLRVANNKGKPTSETVHADLANMQRQREEIYQLVKQTGFDPSHMVGEINPEFAAGIQRALVNNRKEKKKLDRIKTLSSDAKSALSDQ